VEVGVLLYNYKNSKPTAKAVGLLYYDV